MCVISKIGSKFIFEYWILPTKWINTKYNVCILPTPLDIEIFISLTDFEC